MGAIRNFIYLDNDKLNSLYSQVFEGVAEAIIESYFGATQNIEEQKSIGKTLEEKVGEISGTSTNRVLHDYMYNKFEEKIDDKIVKCGNGIDVSPNSLIKVTGKTRIEDYERLKVYLDEFNNLGLAIAYLQKEDGVSRKNLVALAKESGLQQDKKLLGALKQFLNLFENEGYEVIVNLEEKEYRGIISKKYLRLSPDMIRMLYGNNPCMEWTLVGQVTRIYPENVVESPQEEHNDSSMKGSLSEMFASLDEVEKVFFAYDRQQVYHVLPIAIYIENNI